MKPALANPNGKFHKQRLQNKTKTQKEELE